MPHSTLSRIGRRNSALTGCEPLFPEILALPPARQKNVRKKSRMQFRWGVRICAQ